MSEQATRPGALIHTADMLGHPVRFFRSPLPGDDLPWHAVEDLHRALGMCRGMRQNIEAGMRQEWATELRTIRTGGKSVLIAGHSIAQGTADAMDGTAPGHGPDGHGPRFNAYVRAIAEAYAKMNMLDGLTPMEAISRGIRAATRGESGHVH